MTVLRSYNMSCGSSYFSRIQCTCFSLQSSTPSSISCCLSCKPSSKVLIWPSTYALSLCPRFLVESERQREDAQSHHYWENIGHPCYGHWDGAIQFLRAHNAAGITNGENRRVNKMGGWCSSVAELNCFWSLANTIWVRTMWKHNEIYSAMGFWGEWQWME